jgi:hypothetical protein
MSEVREQRRAVQADWWEVGWNKSIWRVDSAIFVIIKVELTIEERVEWVPWHVNFSLTKCSQNL